MNTKLLSKNGMPLLYISIIGLICSLLFTNMTINPIKKLEFLPTKLYACEEDIAFALNESRVLLSQYEIESKSEMIKNLEAIEGNFVSSNFCQNISEVLYSTDQLGSDIKDKKCIGDKALEDKQFLLNQLASSRQRSIECCQLDGGLNPKNLIKMNKMMAEHDLLSNSNF